MTAALTDFQQQLIPLIRYHGIRRVALFARPLIYDNPVDSRTDTDDIATSIPLDWQTETLPLLMQQLQDLPKLRIDIHVPKGIKLSS